jgi:putative transposase
MQSKNEYKHFHRRRLPHLQPTDKILFITFGLYLSMPNAYYDYLTIKEAELNLQFKDKLTDRENQITINKKLFAIKDNYMDRFQSKENILRLSNCAKIMANELHYQDKRIYNLLAYTIMPNHVHLLIEPIANEKSEYYSIASIMNQVKGRSSRFINKELNRTGKLWQIEYYDHFVRNEDEMYNIIYYIIMNPEKAGLVHSANEWEWTWVSKEFEEVIL